MIEMIERNMGWIYTKHRDQQSACCDLHFSVTPEKRHLFGLKTSIEIRNTVKVTVLLNGSLGLWISALSQTVSVTKAHEQRIILGLNEVNKKDLMVHDVSLISRCPEAAELLHSRLLYSWLLCRSRTLFITFVFTTSFQLLHSQLFLKDRS